MLIKVFTRRYSSVFFGSDEFSLPSLIKLSSHLGADKVSVVVSNLNNVIGKYAKLNNLQLFQWEDYKGGGCGGAAELGVVASFGYLIPAKVIQKFPLGILNVHASLLPRWRGAAPIAHAIINGDEKTGISIMRIIPHRFDVGPVLYQKEVPLDPHILRTELTDRLAEVGSSALIHVLQNLPHFLKTEMKQDESEAKQSPKLVQEMSIVDWTKSSKQIYNLYRGLYGVFKLKTEYLGKRVDLDEISLGGNCIELRDRVGTNGTIPGQILFKNNLLFVKCSSADHIIVRKVKLGNKWMTAKDFQNGFLSKVKISERIFNSFKDEAAIGSSHVEIKQ